MNLWVFFSESLHLTEGTMRAFGKISSLSFLRNVLGKEFEEKIRKKLALKLGKTE